MDNYFAAARDGLDIDPPPAPKAGKAGISSTGQGPGTANPLGAGSSSFPGGEGEYGSDPRSGGGFPPPGGDGFNDGFGTTSLQPRPTNEPDPEMRKRMKNAQL